MIITITHAAAEGTLLEGTARGDGTAETLRTNGWRWSRTLGSWYLPHSRDRAPKAHIINNTADQLRNAGRSVDIIIDDARRDTAVVEADLANRRKDRAVALATKAERREAAAVNEAERAARALRHLPEGGEPIKVGHHSEAKHRNAIARADSAIHRSIDADDEARRARARADVAARSTEARYAPVTVANRIEKLRAETASVRRRIDGYTRTLAGGYLDVTPPAEGEYAERLEDDLLTLTDQLAYWQHVRAEQISTGQVTAHSRETIAAGDLVRYLGTWCTVTRTNQKSVTIIDAYGHRGTVPYSHIRDHRRPDDEASE